MSRRDAVQLMFGSLTQREQVPHQPYPELAPGDHSIGSHLPTTLVRCLIKSQQANASCLAQSGESSSTTLRAAWVTIRSALNRRRQSLSHPNAGTSCESSFTADDAMQQGCASPTTSSRFHWAPESDLRPVAFVPRCESVA
jgi:hypothetical protein